MRLIIFLSLFIAVFCESCIERNEYTFKKFGDGAITGNFTYIIDRLHDDVHAYFPGQGDLYGKAAVIGSLSQAASGALGNYQIGDYDPNYNIATDCYYGVVAINRTLMSPRSGRSMRITVYDLLTFDDNGLITEITEVENYAKLEYVLNYLYYDVFKFCGEFVDVCRGEGVFGNLFGDTVLDCIFALRDKKQTVTEKDSLLMGDTIMCRNFFFTPILFNKQGIPGFESFTCSMVAADSPVCN